MEYNEGLDFINLDPLPVSVTLRYHGRPLPCLRMVSDRKDGLSYGAQHCTIASRLRGHGSVIR